MDNLWDFIATVLLIALLFALAMIRDPLMVMP